MKEPPGKAGLNHRAVRDTAILNSPFSIFHYCNRLNDAAFDFCIRCQNLHEELEPPECILDNRLIGIRRAEHGMEHMAAVRMDAGSVVRTGDHAEK